MDTYQDFIRNRGTSILKGLPTNSTNDFVVDFTRVKNIFIVCGRTDMCKGMDDLVSIVQYEYNMDSYDNAIFLFCCGKSDRFKVLYWNEDGFILLYKRINDGKLKCSQKSEKS